MRSVLFWPLRKMVRMFSRSGIIVKLILLAFYVGVLFGILALVDTGPPRTQQTNYIPSTLQADYDATDEMDDGGMIEQVKAEYKVIRAIDPNVAALEEQYKRVRDDPEVRETVEMGKAVAKTMIGE